MHRAKGCQGTPQKDFNPSDHDCSRAQLADAKFVAKKNTPNEFSRSHEFIATPHLVLSGSKEPVRLPECGHS